jgi:hypothetical protein
MSLETGTYISSLNSSNPVTGDAKTEGDDHIRLIKSTLLNTFPSITGAVSATHTELSYVAAGSTSGTWTPVDGSGAGLTFTGVSGEWVRHGKIIWISGTVTYPSTASGANASISGLPVTVNSSSNHWPISTGYCTESTLNGLMAMQSTTYMNLYSSSGLITNAVMSSDQLYFAGCYRVA